MLYRLFDLIGNVPIDLLDHWYTPSPCGDDGFSSWLFHYAALCADLLVLSDSSIHKEEHK